MSDDCCFKNGCNCVSLASISVAALVSTRLSTVLQESETTGIDDSRSVSVLYGVVVPVDP